jgi:hypothetical protein
MYDELADNDEQEEYARVLRSNSGRQRAVGACRDTRQGEPQTVPARVSQIAGASEL